MNDFKKLVADSGENILYEINKCSRENNNLVEWIKIYDEQIKNYQKEIYDLNLKLYFSSSQQPQQQQLSHQPQYQPQQDQSQQQLDQPQSLKFKSLADYFDYLKNQE